MPGVAFPGLAAAYRYFGAIFALMGDCTLVMVLITNTFLRYLSGTWCMREHDANTQAMGQLVVSAEQELYMYELWQLRSPPHVVTTVLESI